MRFLFVTLALASLTAASPATAQDRAAAGWQAMAFHDFTTPSATDPLQAVVWPDVIREQNAYVTTELKRPLNGKNALVTALASTYRDGDRTIIVSVISTRACDHGANSRGAEIEASTCPVRIATLQNGKLASMKTLVGCYADHADPDLPAKNRRDGTYSRFDPAAGTILLRTTVGGKDVLACTHTYSIR